MSKIFFFSIPAYGHINPTLNVIKTLVERKNSVYCFTTKEFKPMIESVGGIFCPYTKYEKIDLRIGKDITKGAEILLNVTDEESSYFLEQILKEKPDCILHDSIALWGKAIATKLNIPAVSLITTFAITKRVLLSYPSVFYKYFYQVIAKTKNNYKNIQHYNRIAKKYNLDTNGIMDLYLNEEDLNIVFTSRLLQPLGMTFRKRFVFVGSSIGYRPNNNDMIEIKDKKEIIYISLGTIYNDNLLFYRECINAFKDTRYQIILSIGRRYSQKDLPFIPSNFIVKNFVPQLEILRKASLFITHAGMNSVNESLYYGVPMLCIPQMEEQIINALRVKQLGAGKILEEKDVTSEVVFKTAEEIINTESFYMKAKEIQESLRNSGGYKRAAEEIIAYLEEKRRKHNN